MGEFRGNQYTENEYDDYEYQDLLADVRLLAVAIGETPTTRDAMIDDRLPCLERIYDLADGGWNGVLDDAGVGRTQVETYAEEERAAMLDDLRQIHAESDSDHLTTREYRERGKYATSTIKKTFGSWAEACEEAGIEAGEKYGTSCTGPRGATLDSRHERRVARLLFDLRIEYVAHPTVPDTDWIADFHLPERDLWIEVDGFDGSDRPNAESFQNKLAHYASTGMEFVVVEDPVELEAKLLE